MNFNIVVPNISGYVHTAAFLEIAETVKYGLLGLGATISSDGRPIIFGANLLRHTLPENSIVFNLEQVFSKSPWLTPEVILAFKKCVIWDYSKKNIDAWSRFNVRAVHVPVGYAPEMTRIDVSGAHDIDVLFYGSINDRRHKILSDLRSRGIRVHTCFGVYGKERDELIARSKIVLNIHFYETKIFEIIRVSYLLANRVAVVSETGLDASEREFVGGVAFADYDGLVDTCLTLLNDESQRQSLKRRGFAIMSSRSQSSYLLPALAALI